MKENSQQNKGGVVHDSSRRKAIQELFAKAGIYGED
jgi:hypothetical protein